MDQIDSALLKSVIVVIVWANLVKGGRAQHANEQVGVSKPFNTFISGADVAKNDLGVQIVCKLRGQLTLDG